MTAQAHPDLSNHAHGRDLPAALVRVALVELARRGITPDFGPHTMRKAVPAAELFLHAIGVEWSALDRLPENVVDFAAYRARKAVRHA
jgi:hypothetical protein